MKKTRRPKTAGNAVLEAGDQIKQEPSGDLELLLAQTSAALEKANRQLQDRAAEYIRVEAECKLAADRYHALINNIPGAVYRCANDDSWTMEFISNQIEELSGYPAEEFLYNRVRSYKSIIHREDVVHVFEQVQAGLLRRKPYVIEYRIVHKDGTFRFVWEKGQGVFGIDGELRHLDGVIFDVTDRVGSFSGSEEET